MFGEQYQVDYIINLQDNATAGIRTFSSAASRLAKAAKDFDKISVAFNKMTATFNKQLELKISTSNASRKLNRIIKQLERIDGLAKGINLGVAGGVSTRGASVSRTVAAPAPRQTRTQTVRPIVAPKNGQPLVPRNLEYQVLGPTRLGNVAMLDMFKGMGLMYGISAVGSGIRDIVQNSAEYENIMQTAKNILKTNYKGGNFNVAFADMEKIARAVGVETKFTAPEVADAVKFLAMAGLPIEAIKKSIRPIADIALIGDTDLGSTADVMTNIMTAYKIKSDDMRKTADIMSRTFTMSNTTLMELAESFKMSGSVLQQNGVPFETAAAAFGVLGDAGIKATMAGTTMRTIIANMKNPTKKQLKYWEDLGVERMDKYGNLRDITDIFGDLAKLSNKDALDSYKKLQKEYAPKFEGLEEGSAAWKKLEDEYNAKSDEIFKDKKGVDVYRLFRLTAASGGGVLIDSIAKWNKIIEENLLSEGLSQKLADEKKNQIVGLWKQVTSAFQEGGLKVFQENDSLIRGYLQGAISWLKSDQFTNVLRSVIDLVTELASVLLKFTKAVVFLYEKFKPLVKYFLEFQIYLKGLQTILISFKQFGNALLYGGSFLLGGLAKSPLVQRMMPGLFGFSNAYATTFGTAKGGKTLGADELNPLAAWWVGNSNDEKYISRKWRKDWRFAKSEFGAHFGEDGLLYDDNKELLGPLPYDFYNGKKYRRRTRQAKAMRYAGYTSIGGGILGGILGNAIAPEDGAMWGSMIGGGFGAIAPMLLASGPWGIAATAAITAITGIVAAVKTYHRNIEKADRSTQNWLDSMHDLGISKTTFTSPDMVINKSMEIMSNHMLDLNQKMALQIELYEQLRKQKEGFEEKTTDYKASLLSQPGMEAVKEMIDAYHGLGLGKNKAYETEVEKILKDKLYDGQFIARPGEAKGAFDYHGTRYWFGDRSYPQDFEAFISAQEPNNPSVADAREWLEKNLFSAQSLESFNATINDFWGQSFIAKPDANKKAQDYKDWRKVVTSEALTVPQYANIIKERQQALVDVFMPLRDVFEIMKEGSGDMDKATQSVFGNIIPIFNSKEFGAFGSGDYYKKLLEFYNTALDSSGKLAYKDRPEKFASFLEGQFENTVALFNKLPESVKPYFVKYLDKTMWEEEIGKGFGLYLGNSEGGFYRPERKGNEEKTGDFDWSRMLYVDENGMPYIPNYWNFDSKKIPSIQSQTTNVSSSSGQTAYGFPYYNPRSRGMEFPALPSARDVNEALAMADRGIKVQPNVTKNNTYTFTFHIENLRTDMDEDQLSQFIDERFIPAVIDKLDYSYEGAVSA